eukprot:TRINITY_DN67337_c3_g1_i11.p1 TRINITY_DN67337_c3_g1~~TRINITY_DN67337_c3_g1_i11.p1  ORF type:complete len:544 (-),score=25.75 TRINITY_DN67337_c3_g1_i11:1440-3071(-)
MANGEVKALEVTNEITVPKELVVGPVIGLVTCNYARILIEVPSFDWVKIVLLTPLATQPAATITLPAPTGRPIVYAFTGLQPQTTYQVFVSGYGHPASTFRTFPLNPSLADKLQFGVIACNKVRITLEKISPEGDLWQHLMQLVTNRKLDMLLHVGDQIYGDDDYEGWTQGKKEKEAIIAHCKFLRAWDMLSLVPPSQWPQYKDRVMEMYRSSYRQTWRHWPTRVVLANIPNIMVYDDHEMRDDIGDKEEDYDVSSLTRFIAECARVVTFEYQRQLYEDIDLNQTLFQRVPRENHILHPMGDYGLLFVDGRGAKVFNHTPDDPRPFLTTAQFNDLRENLLVNGSYDSCKVLIVLSQIPILFFGRSITEKVAEKADDFEGMWQYKSHESEAVELLELIWQWKSRAPWRHVILAGGDVHLGGYTEVYRGDKWAFTQLIVGPIANLEHPHFVMLGSQVLKKMLTAMPHGWTWQHYNWTKKRNFGIISLQEETPTVVVSHVTASTNHTQHEEPHHPNLGVFLCGLYTLFCFGGIAILVLYIFYWRGK